MTAITHRSTAAVENANFRHLVADIAWFGLAFTSTSRFLSVFALRLGASEADLGWMTSLPALLIALSTTYVFAWRARRRDSVSALFVPTFIFRLIFLLPAFTPLLPKAWQVPWLIVSATLPAIGQGMAAVLFVASIQESVSQPRMASLFSRRSLFFNLTLAASAVLFGFWLEHVPFPLNYQLMYLVSFGFALLSMWHCMQLKPIQVPAHNPRHRLALLPLEPWRSREFRSMTLIMIVTFVAFYAVFALVNARLVKEMGADEGYMAVFSLVELAAGALISYYAPRLIARFTYRGGISIMMAVTALPPLLLALSDHLAVGLIAAVISGASWTFVAMVGISGLYTETTPVDEATHYGVAYHQAYGLATFAAPFIGTILITGGISLTSALVIGAGLRLLASLAVAYSWWHHTR